MNCDPDPFATGVQDALYAYLNFGKAAANNATAVTVQAYAYVPNGDGTNIIIQDGQTDRRIVLSASVPTLQVVTVPSFIPAGAMAIIANVYTFDTSGSAAVSHSFGRNGGTEYEFPSLCALWC